MLVHQLDCFFFPVPLSFFIRVFCYFVHSSKRRREISTISKRPTNAILNRQHRTPNTEHIFLYKAQKRIRFVYEDDAQLENVWYPWLYVWVHIFGRCFHCGIRLYFVGKIHAQFYYGYVPCTQYSIHFVPIRRAFFLCKQTCLITKMFHSSSTKVFFYLSRSIHYTL